MVKNNQPIIIAGPCAIENKNQFASTIQNIYNNVDIVRCGVWKGRTSPKSYPGKGTPSLTWIKEAQKKYKTPFAIEIGTVNHIQLALENDIKIFWIGARTTSNPFAVEELAKKLKNLNIEIWIKNPIFSDLKLWFGAIERLYINNLRNLKVIHRGFYSEQSTQYRNPPRWDLLKKFQAQYPNIPIIFDPSHICGDKKLISKVSKKALEFGVDGLMIEVHNNPEEALSDKNQQLNPVEFKQLLDTLI